MSPPATEPSAKSSRASTELLAQSKAFFLEVLVMAFGFVGFVLHNRLSPGENPAWLPTEDEQHAVCAPLASIAARHAPVGDVVQGDVGDAIVAGVAGTAYAMRSAADQHRAQPINVDATEPPPQ